MMRNNNKLDEGDMSKNDQNQVVAEFSSSIKEVRHVASTNQQKLQQLELAIANLTTICSAIRHDMYSLSSSSSSNNDPGSSSFGKARAEVVEMKQSSSRSCSSPRLDSKNDMLGLQMQQLVKQAAALGIHKDSNSNSIKISGKMKEESKPPTRAVRKNVQASKNQRSSTKSFIRSKESTTTEKKMSMKLETVKNNNMGATQTKAKRPPEGSGVGKNIKANNNAANNNVSLKSAVKRTSRTTISKVYVKQQSGGANKSKKDSSIIVKNKNVDTIQGKDEKCWPKNHASTTNRNILSNAADSSELKQPRKKWSTAN